MEVLKKFDEKGKLLKVIIGGLTNPIAVLKPGVKYTYYNQELQKKSANKITTITGDTKFIRKSITNKTTGEVIAKLKYSYIDDANFNNYIRQVKICNSGLKYDKAIESYVDGYLRVKVCIYKDGDYDIYQYDYSDGELCHSMLTNKTGINMYYYSVDETGTDKDNPDNVNKVINYYSQLF